MLTHWAEWAAVWAAAVWTAAEAAAGGGGRYGPDPRAVGIWCISWTT